MSEDKFSSGLNDFLSVTDNNEDDEMMEAPPVKKKTKAEKPAEKPKKVEPKHDKKPAQTAEKQICSLYLPTETLNEINNFKGFLNISAGDMVAKAIDAWKEQNKDIADYIAKGQTLKENMK